MRIISGIHKGRRLMAPKNLPARPTTDFAKEGLFNTIGNDVNINDIDVLDLFAGIGGITFEFASRGAKKIVCIDENYNCISFIKKTARELEFNQINAFKNDVFRYLKKYDTQFDIIFADPPYQLKNIDQVPELVFEKNLLKENGILILEHDRNWDFSEHKNFVKHRKYSNVNFSFFENT
ncbi:MAG: 16S rRNA (guanine(966)-N(2))-methyltransferase RsmD [Flavobacteriales bacterium]|nr:16S rRNA (guanine(966)-N(2))-methyltransferase RsmD [Flavobacteriales bacterium]